MRLIEAGALDGADTEALAARVGVGARHLTRLFQRHLGCTPAQVAATARLLRAKRLVDETDLSMTDVAAEAGFGSLRAFNARFRAVYGFAPSKLRQKRTRKAA